MRKLLLAERDLIRIQSKEKTSLLELSPFGWTEFAKFVIYMIKRYQSSKSLKRRLAKQPQSLMLKEQPSTNFKWSSRHKETQ